MPRYPWLIANDLDRSETINKLTLMKDVFDVPYTDAQIDTADAWVDNQAKYIVNQIFTEAADLKQAYATRPEGELEKKEIIALIAYLQRLGTDIKTTQVQTASNN